MKQLNILNDIICGENPDKDLFDVSVEIKNFHSSFIKNIIINSKTRLYIEIDDALFISAYKDLSFFWNDDSVLFIGGDAGSPQGFVSDESVLFDRARRLLSGGLTDKIKTIIVSSSGKLKPIVSPVLEERFNINKDSSYEGCLKFIKLCSYVLVEAVSSPGEFCLKGGIVDLFPFGSHVPFRILFFDSVEIYSFNVETQITEGRFNNLELINPKETELLPIDSCSLKNFFMMYINDAGLRAGSLYSGFVQKTSLNHLPFNLFTKNSDLYSEFIICEDLDSIGLVYKKVAYIPAWFVNYKNKDYNQSLNSSSFEGLRTADININDYVVHRDHGVGVYRGLSVDSNECEKIIIQYDDGGRIYVDVSKLSLVSYFAPSGAVVNIDSLSKQGSWIRRRASAKKRAHESVDALLSLYIKRKKVYRKPYVIDPDLEQLFISSFPHSETEDQSVVWKEISEDLSSSGPMDRLLCGDVGFGKTEISIRSAFRVVVGGKRVVVMAPTTILANQLYSSFQARLNEFGINIDVISRFKTNKERNTIKQNINQNKNDILIGTSAVLNDTIYFINSGLIIIDEEHRFGVKQKDFIKKQRDKIDVLSMSATPIPRSVNLAVSNIYSISMLQTAPLLRRPIYTRIKYFDYGFIKESILFEANRGGQIFFVHNNVDTIVHTTEKLKQLVSSVNIDYIHGQEASKNIETKMSDFIKGKIQVLVCTSIIESGIDVPQANCIIINNSHLFGLAQLYQMRGRVGRGSVQAYAYLLIPKKIQLSNVAYKRIKTIEEKTSLGSGYGVAFADMEIRGGGSLFGYSQSGGSGSVGYEMYTKLIEEVLEETIEDVPVNINRNVEIKFFNNRKIDESYISSDSKRLKIYTQISNCLTLEDFEKLKFIIINQFGPLPNSLNNLISENKIKPLLFDLGVSSIIRKGCGVVFSLVSSVHIDSSIALINYITDYFSKQNINCHILPSKKQNLKICIHLDSDEDSFSKLLNFIDNFTTWK